MNQFLTLAGVSLDYTLSTIILNIIFAFLIGFVLAWVYQRTFRGLSYSASFVSSLVLLTVAGSVLVMIVGNSLARAFSLFGAFSIIRFRTAVKETRDIVFVFLALIFGMAVGTNNYMIAVISVALVGGGILLMHRRQYGVVAAADQILSLTFPDKGDTKVMLNFFTANLSAHQLVNLASWQEQKTVEMTYNIKFKPGVEPMGFVKSLKKIKGVNNLRLVNVESGPVI